MLLLPEGRGAKDPLRVLPGSQAHLPQEFLGALRSKEGVPDHLSAALPKKRLKTLAANPAQCPLKQALYVLTVEKSANPEVVSRVT